MSNFEPLDVIINPPPSSVVQIYSGQTSKLSIVVNNQDRERVVEVYLDIPKPMRSWCNISRTSFNLDSGRSQSVEFIWQIPIDAIPNRYRYNLVVESPSLKVPLLYTLELEILTPIQTPVSRNNPTFIIQPPAFSTHPIELKTNPLIIQVLVHNRSNLGDDFRLSCSDLDDNWYSIRYSKGIQQQDLIYAENKLSLNPNTQGQITLLLHPPENTIAGNYRFTICLHSTVDPDLVLQDSFYFYIPPTYQINFQIQTIREKVRQQPALYQVVAINEGNTIREIRYQPGNNNEENICQYQIEPSPLKIPPGKTVAVGFKVKPKKHLIRPFLGNNKPIYFTLNVEDLHHLPLPSYLPLKGFFLWESRPLWQFILLVLSGIITVSGLAFLIWWLFFKPPILPEIILLKPTKNSYKFGQEINVDWKIKNPQKLKEIQLVSKNNQGKKAINILKFDREQLLKDSRCQFQKEQLDCINISTGIKKPDNYTFILNVLAKKRWKVEEISLKKETKVTLSPPPTPTVSNVYSSQTEIIVPGKVDLKFKISEPQELEKVNLIKNGVILTTISPTNLNKVCKVEKEKTLNCHVQIPVSKPETYIFSVEAIPKYPQYVQPQGSVDAKQEVIGKEQKIDLSQPINLYPLN